MGSDGVPAETGARHHGRNEGWVRDVGKRLSALLALMLATALVAPASALAYDWTKSPVNPLVKGGVHSTAKFKKLVTSNSKVRSAMRGVIKADKYPGWVFSAATKQAAAGNIHSSSLKHGSRIGAMGYGLKKTRIVRNTIWNGNGHLPYYYVYANRTVVESGYYVTTSYRVCLAKTCANPFIISRRVTRAPANGNLFVETRDVNNVRVGGVPITGTVGTQSISVQTTDTAPTPLGQFPVGTPYDLSPGAPGVVGESTPLPGHLTGTVPAGDFTIVFVSAPI
jgi:hypothetical protein